MKSAGSKPRARLCIRVFGVWIAPADSTFDNRADDHKSTELRAVAKGHGWSVVGVFEDAGISGPRVAKTDQRLTRCSRRWRAVLPTTCLIDAQRVAIDLLTRTAQQRGPRQVVARNGKAMYCRSDLRLN
jgi:hypothetical protein